MKKKAAKPTKRSKRWKSLKPLMDAALRCAIDGYDQNDFVLIAFAGEVLKKGNQISKHRGTFNYTWFDDTKTTEPPK